MKKYAERMILGLTVVGVMVGAAAVVRDAMVSDSHSLIASNRKLMDANKQLVAANKGLYKATLRLKADADESVNMATVRVCTTWMDASTTGLALNERYNINTGDWLVSKLDEKTWTFMRVR